MERLIRNCTILDGSGEKAFPGSVGIDRGKLTVYREGPLPNADTVTDGTGLTVLPGFIDSHSHGDLTMKSRYPLVAKLNQGITSQIAGQCGVSMFPADPGRKEEFLRFVKGLAPHPDTDDGKGLADAEAFYAWTSDCPVMTKSFVGHGALRLSVMGYANRKPDAAELERMKRILRTCIRQGAMGLSCGLVYPPNCYADNDEILALLRVCREEGGMFACHPRNESDRCVEAREESVRLAEEAGVPLCFSHLKAAGRDNWGKAGEMLQLAERMLDRGGRILIDTYPYTAGSTGLDVSIPPEYFTHGRPGMVRALEDPAEREKIRSVILTKTADYENYVYNCGGWEHVLIGSCDRMHDGEGLTVAEYAERLGMEDPFDAYVKVLTENGGSALAIYFHMNPAEVEQVLLHPACAVGTDGLLGAPDGNPHPRTFGTMPHAFHMMTSGEHAVSAEQAVRKMTGLPADFFGLSGKGYVRTGRDADLLLIDPKRFRDTADYRHGNGLCTGILEVISGGKTVFREGDGF